MATEKLLIDANAFYRYLEEIRQIYLEEDTLSSNFAAELIETVQDEYLKYAPTADAVEVVHAHWIEDDLCCRRYCSACGFVVHDDACTDMYGDYQIKPKYCPDCGAKMDGEGRR